MENVPVKISENYKPPPRLYQLPQATANKLLLPTNYYNEAPQFCYTFQLEKKVLAKIPEWRRMRQLEKDARRERKDRREQQRQQRIESEQKQLLGAVSYPSTEDLSSSESENEVGEKTENLKHPITEVENVVKTTQCSNFNNILQPTVIVHNLSNNTSSNEENVSSITPTTHAGNAFGASKFTNVFNYKDFEEDTSSPFDNIELKTIDDIDILRQVLHTTLQCKPQKESESDQQENTKGVVQNQGNLLENSENIKATKEVISADSDSTHTTNHIMHNAVDLKIIENNKSALERVDFNDLNSQLQNENIPNPKTGTMEMVSNNYMCYAPKYSPFVNQHGPYTSYNQLYNGLEQQQYSNLNYQPSIYTNQNYLYASNTNGSNTYFNSSPATQFIGHNANTYLNPNVSVNATFNSPQILPSHERVLKSEDNLKSKSVPNILKELREEIRNSEIRRCRNYSHTSDDTKETEKDNNSLRQVVAKKQEPQCYTELDSFAQKLTKNISSMGFPLERVAKIALLFGADDKKIIEHLIPLSELVDLGFDEAKISAALMKFNNNKEKALEYLIS